MGAVIGGMWERFFTQGIYEAIPDKCSGMPMGIYSGYAGGILDDYDFTAGCQTLAEGNAPEGMALIRIPAGKYARFVVKGHMHAQCQILAGAVEDGSGQSFQGGFEEYRNQDVENAEIHIYVGLK